MTLLIASCGGQASFEQKAGAFSGGDVDYVTDINSPEDLAAALELYGCGEDGQKMNVCHIPPGNPAAEHNICIGVPAVDTHVDHHQDYLGDCKGACDDGECDGGGDDDGSGGDDDDLYKARQFSPVGLFFISKRAVFRSAFNKDSRIPRSLNVVSIA